MSKTCLKCLRGTVIGLVAGLLMNPLFYRSEWSFSFMGPTFVDGGVRTAVTPLLSPPYWPVSFEQMDARLEFIEFETNEQKVGNLKVRGCRVPHPGGSMTYRIDDTEDDSSLVFSTDIGPFGSTDLWA